MISLLYPQSVLEPRAPDEMFRQEADAMAATGRNIHLIDTEALISGPARIRPQLEGGLCVRRVEDFIAGSERRYFVLNRAPYTAEPDVTIPEPVTYCAEAIPSPFFSVDVARRADGVDRIVEVGDGQVSDFVGWSVERFVEIWG